MSSNALIGLKVFSVDPVSRRQLIDVLSVVPGGSVLDFTQTIPASGTFNLATPATNTIISISSTPQATQTYISNSGAVVAPTASPYAPPPNPVVPTVDITLYPVGGGSLTLTGVSSVAILPINVSQISITNRTSENVDVHIIQSTT